ncbi:MAG: hypothetical protein LBH00_02790 [Planctomycetaceae bacterium]|jgi:hypothetical protein|nr:hypothetical protein [Planctomycetaceae bacterium]
MYRSLFFFGLCFGLTLPAVSAELGSAVSDDGRIRAAWVMTPDKPYLADTLTLTLSVECPGNIDVEFPPFGESLGELTITRTEVLRRQLVLTAIPKHAGKMPIWSVALRCGDQTLTIPDSEIEIFASVSENASLNDIGLSAKPIAETNWFYYVLAIFAIFTILLLLLYFLKRKKKEETAEINPLSVQEQALQRLAVLMESRKHESDIKAFFIDLSDIVRWYAECMTGIRVPELTTEEFLYKIVKPEYRYRSGDFLPARFADQLKMLVPFLESADIVKFAKHQPTDDEVMTAFRRAEEFIQSHTPYGQQEELNTDTSSP